jgi:ubiquinone/menaquinone biosynthesis C-methylase UbiE
MDEIAEYNRARWKALVEAGAVFTRPKFNLDADSARRLVDPDGKFGDVAKKDVLCLAGGGGQQSAAFALLGANVTVFDLSEDQLKRDIETARFYKTEIKIEQGDIRDLSGFEKASFDIVYHAYSINFVPDAAEVFRQVARVLRVGGIYHFGCANPFVMGVGQNDWNGEGYVLKQPYTGGARISYDDQDWVYDRRTNEKIPNPIEYRHTLSSILNGLIENGFVISHVSDNRDMNSDLTAAPKTWEHLTAFAPPWLSLLAIFRPDFKIE